MPNAIAYSPRLAASQLKRIDPAELRIPSAEEMRARRNRLLGKPSREDAPVAKPVIADFTAYNSGDLVKKVVCGIATSLLDRRTENEAAVVSEKSIGNIDPKQEQEDAIFSCGYPVECRDFAPSRCELPAETAVISEVLPETDKVFDITTHYKMAYSSFETRAAKTRLILQTICDKHAITMKELLSARRVALFARARQEACYVLATERQDLSWPMIGRLINKDHTSAIHAAKRYAEIHGLPQVVRI